MLHLILCLLSLVILSPQVYGQEKSNFVISPTVVFITHRVYRGALIWEKPLLLAGASFTFFQHIKIGPRGLELFHSFSKNFRLSLSFSYFDDERPSDYALKFGTRPENFRNSRPSTYDGNLFLYWKLHRLFKVNLQYSKDLKRHKGQYFYAKIGSGILPFTTLSIGVGTGTSEMNQYIYGQSAKSGIGHVDYSLGVFIPFLPWNGKLRAAITLPKIKSAQNRQGHYVRPDDAPVVFTTVAFWPISL